MLIIVIHILRQLPHLIHIRNMTIGILMNVVLVMNQIRILTVVIVVTMIKKTRTSEGEIRVKLRLMVGQTKSFGHLQAP